MTDLHVLIRQLQGRLAAMETAVTLEPIAEADAPLVSVFVSSADNKLKFKDSGGTVNALY